MKPNPKPKIRNNSEESPETRNRRKQQSRNKQIITVQAA
jgi:hypothetical protein